MCRHTEQYIILEKLGMMSWAILALTFAFTNEIGKGWENISIIESLPGMHKVLSSVPNSTLPTQPSFYLPDP